MRTLSWAQLFSREWMLFLVFKGESVGFLPRTRRLRTRSRRLRRPAGGSRDSWQTHITETFILTLGISLRVCVCLNAEPFTHMGGESATFSECNSRYLTMIPPTQQTTHPPAWRHTHPQNPRALSPIHATQHPSTHPPEPRTSARTYARTQPFQFHSSPFF